MREPSIHIMRHQFENILSEMEIEGFPIDAFFVRARKVALNTRAVLVKNKVTNKKISKVLLASHGDAALVADIIYATRIKLKHRGVRKINEATPRDWAVCKKLAEICNTFCNDFQLETREGFIEYIEIGLGRMTDNKNLLNRLVNMQENITNQYAAELDILEYDDKKTPHEIHDYFIRKIADATGIYESYEDRPERYVHFLRLDSFLKKKGWPYKGFIDAQFESLAWCNGLPDIAQLYNDKAIERYNKYLYKYKKQTEEPEVQGSLWEKIK